MKKILLGLVAAFCLSSFAVPAFAQDTGGDKTTDSGKKAKPVRKTDEKKQQQKKGEAPR